MFAAEKGFRKDLTNIRKTFYVQVIDDGNIIIDGLERGAEYAGMGHKPEQENKADQRNVIIGNLVGKIGHDLAKDAF